MDARIKPAHDDFAQSEMRYSKNTGDGLRLIG